MYTYSMSLYSLVPEFPPISSHPPSALADLKVMLVTVGGTDMLNISWAVNIDGRRQHFIFFSTWKLILPNTNGAGDMASSALIVKY